MKLLSQWARQWWVLSCLGWVGWGLAAAENPSAEVYPWFGDNAVLLPAERLTNRLNTALPVLGGTARDSRRLRLTFSRWPQSPIEVPVGERRGSQTWSMDSGHFSRWGVTNFYLGQQFDLQITTATRHPEPLLAVTNLVVGQVWVLVVNPAQDREVMAPLSASAKQRVRVLPLEGSSWSTARGTWMDGAQAERLDERLFCGLPRAFANALADRPVDPAQGEAIGLVLVQRPFIAEWLQGQKVVAPFLLRAASDPRIIGRPLLVEAALAAQVAVSGPTVGAVERNSLAKEENRKRQADLKRQGLVGAYFSEAFHSWERLAPHSDARQMGDESLVPFRVTGVIW